MAIITLVSGKSFESQSGESILDAAARAQITLAYSCKTGRCSTCKCKVMSGHTSALHDELGLTEQERREGWVLGCVRSADNDVTIDAEDLSSLSLHPAKTVPCRIHTIERVNDDVINIRLRLPPTADFPYNPGQYVDIIGPNGIRRSYSIANAPAADKLIELQIKQVQGGVMSQYWFDVAQLNDLLRLHGPLGTFFLRDVAGKDLILLATGTGIAPVKAILEGLQTVVPEQLPRSIRVYWGGRTAKDLYWSPSGLSIPLTYIPVLSRGDDAWTGRRGYIQDVVISDANDWPRTVVYACGSEAMIISAGQALKKAGLDERRFYSDAFVCSSSN